MAISQMQQLSLILPKALLDDLLFYLQGLESVQIHNLREKEDWQEAFEAQLVSQPQPAGAVSQDGDLLKRQEALEKMIGHLEPFLPKKKLLASLKERPMELAFEDLEAAGAAQDEAALLTKIRKQLKVLEKAQDQIAADQEELADLEKWERLEVTPQALKSFSHLAGLIGTIPNDQNDGLRARLAAQGDLEYQEVFTNETEHGILVFYKPGAYEEVARLLEESGFKPFEYEREELPTQRLADLRADIGDQRAVEEATRSQLAAAGQELQQLKIQLDYVLNLSSRQQAKSGLAATQNLTALEGWIETDQLAQLQDRLAREFGSAVLLESREISEQEQNQVPTKLKNSRLIEPFELVTEMYALPKYGDKDPTPIVSLFYFVFFGMMVADIGYGLLLFLATSLALRFFYVKPGLAKNLRFFRLLGLAVIIWGVIYGSFFGFQLPFALINTSTDIMTILTISVIFGFITVLAGLWFSGTKNLRLRDYGEAYNSGFAWVLILLGLALLVLGNLFPGLALLIGIGQWLAILNAIGILVVSLATSKKITGLIAGLFNLYNISSYVGDLVSFTRLMALGLAGASMGSAFNLIVSLFPPLGRYTIGIVAFVLLHLVNMSLAFLSGYVHSARLIFVEFFGKFYDGGGKAFSPLKPAEKYVKQKNKHSA